MSGGEIGIVGAGIAGLACARALIQRGRAVQLFDKGRGPGGRTCSRRRDGDRFDHGAAFFTCHDARFGSSLNDLAESGYVAPWTARFARWSEGELTPFTPPSPRWVGTPAMSGLAKGLAAALPADALCCGIRIARLEGSRGNWRLRDDTGKTHGPYTHVVVTAPAPQTAALLRDSGLTDARLSRLDAASMAPCWALMVSFHEALDLPVDAIEIDGAPVSWLAREASKPGRAPGHRWVVHASPDASRAQLEEPADHVAANLLAALRDMVGPLPATDSLDVHRWRYARVTEAAGEPALYAADLGVGACGDWCRGARVEEAFLSGLAMADLLVDDA